MDMFDELIAAYAEVHRAYHTLDHIIDCLRELDEVAASAQHPIEIEIALWFHDAVYDSRREDNEERSAQWAGNALRRQDIAEPVVARVQNMIRATRHRSPPRTADEELLLDVDLAILGSDRVRFERYDEEIRREYSWVPEDDYRRARSRVLQSFLDRHPLYRTDAIRERYEGSARRNLARAISA